MNKAHLRSIIQHALTNEDYYTATKIGAALTLESLAQDRTNSHHQELVNRLINFNGWTELSTERLNAILAIIAVQDIADRKP